VQNTACQQALEASIFKLESVIMQQSEVEFLNWLAAKATIEQSAMHRIVAAAATTGATGNSAILELGILPEEQLADELAAFLKLDRLAPDGLMDIPQEIQGVSIEFLLDAGVLPLPSPEGELHIATSQPLIRDRAIAAAYFGGFELVMKVATQSVLQKKISELRQSPGIDGNDLEVTTLMYGEGDTERLRDLASEAPVVRLLSRLVGSAVEQNASDIHFEPIDQKLQVRFRVDGVLRIAEMLDAQSHLALVSRIKILAKLNIAEQRLPQDGRIRLAIRGKNIDFRVATSPTVGGESVVLRILDRRDVRLDFSALGFSESDQSRLDTIFQHKDGIVLVTGPTGSGKTTTLYAALNALNRPETKIFTVEDPVEYQIAGINQIPVRTNIGLDFASILRSVLRQDPDIIMIGEIRDAETARVAVQASLTGHLVLSTVHTNSAVAAITRLRDLGLENYLLASSVRAIIAQRLVRKICSACEGTSTQGITCSQCHGSGYHGRTSIYELLEFSRNLQRATAAGKDDSELLAIAGQDNFITLAENGRSLVHSGVTSQAELSRTIVAADP
jgi:general secretion pathway protein E